MMGAKQFKSLLFVPASRLDMAAHAHERGADAVILDLEDGVAAADRPAARAALNSLLAGLERNGVPALVRINSLESGGVLDIEALANRFTPPLLLPKVTEPGQILAVEECWIASGSGCSGHARLRLAWLAWQLPRYGALWSHLATCKNHWLCW